jgi:beta-mannosidase
MRKRLLHILTTLFLLLPAVGLNARAVETIQELNSGWKLHLHNGTTIPATVPGCVYTDLFNAGIIPDPFFGANEAAVSWVSDSTWTYSLEFQVSQRMKSRQWVDIVFKGVDTYAEILLNDTHIVDVSNQFADWRMSVLHLLVEGINTLVVRFTPPRLMAATLENEYGLSLPEDNRVFTRKGQWQYGWDWAPALPSMGLWKGVQLEGFDAAQLISVHLRQEFDGDTLQSLWADFTLYTPGAEKLILSLANPSIVPAEVVVETRSGINNFSLHVVFNEPVKYWWPAGYGEPYLYEFFCRVMSSEQILLAERRIVTGIRKSELIRDPDPLGESFHIQINGVPIFAKGANWVPPDHFPARASDEKYRHLIREARFAGMNMLRVWGGGVYERDLFYQLCDSAGIMVWQDFMFACGMYPDNDRFIYGLTRETIQQVTRLRNNPSVVLWCGNNEVSEGWHRWGWSDRYNKEDSARIAIAYETLFEGLLPYILKMHHPEIPYIHTSPLLGRGDPDHVNRGSAHYWGVWHDGEPFGMYRRKVPRFMSEFGFQAYPPIASLREFIPQEEMQHDSETMAFHQKHKRGNQLIIQYMQEWFPEPESFEQFVLFSQMLQAEGIGIGILAHREAKPWCMGSLYWQFNDTWPAISWSSVDYYGRRKALHYKVSELFQPTIATVNIHRKTIELVSVNDNPAIDSVMVVLTVMTHSGYSVFQQTFHSDAPTHNNRRWELPISLLEDHDLKGLLFVTKVSRHDSLLSKRITLPLVPKELPLLKPDIQRTTTITNQGVKITMVSDVFVYGVVLESADNNATFSNNFFHLLPGEEKVVIVQTEFPEYKIDVCSLIYPSHEGE